MQHAERDSIVLEEENVQILATQKRMHEFFSRRRRIYESVEQGYSMWRDASDGSRKENNTK